MAKLGSSSCRPLVQGMMLLALLLLASIQAGVQGSLVEGVVDMAKTGGKKSGELLHGAEGLVDMAKTGGGWEFLHDDDLEKVSDQLAKTFLASKFCRQPALARFCKGGKMGLRVHNYLCKAVKQNPGGTPFDILGVSKSFPIFYDVTVTSQGRGNSVVTCLSAAVQPQGPASAGTTLTLVQIKGISVGQVTIPVQTLAYRSTTQPAYTYLDSSLYGILRNTVSWEMQALNPYPRAMPITPTIADELCYVSAAPLQLPRIAILLASNNGLWNCS